MSIDSYFYVPAGTRNVADPAKREYKKYKSASEFWAAHAGPFPHQVNWAAGGMIDEQYYFESAEDAIWFFVSGWRDRDFFENGQDGEKVGYAPTAIWIDDQQRCEHCADPSFPARPSRSTATHAGGRWKSAATASTTRTTARSASAIV